MRLLNIGLSVRWGRQPIMISRKTIEQGDEPTVATLSEWIELFSSEFIEFTHSEGVYLRDPYKYIRDPYNTDRLNVPYGTYITKDGFLVEVCPYGKFIIKTQLYLYSELTLTDEVMAFCVGRSTRPKRKKE